MCGEAVVVVVFVEVFVVVTHKTLERICSV